MCTQQDEHSSTIMEKTSEPKMFGSKLWQTFILTCTTTVIGQRGTLLLYYGADVTRVELVNGGKSSWHIHRYTSIGLMIIYICTVTHTCDANEQCTVHITIMYFMREKIQMSKNVQRHNWKHIILLVLLSNATF